MTLKPRIIKTAHGRSFTVERIVPTNHPAVRGYAQCETVDTLAEAFAVAHAWVGPAKPKEKQ
ncbi:MAG TPA: hypothetical protein VF885_16090 [Arthrobacter sp.]